MVKNEDRIFWNARKAKVSRNAHDHQTICEPRLGAERAAVRAQPVLSTRPVRELHVCSRDRAADEPAAVAVSALAEHSCAAARLRSTTRSAGGEWK